MRYLTSKIDAGLLKEREGVLERLKIENEFLEGKQAIDDKELARIKEREDAERERQAELREEEKKAEEERRQLRLEAEEENYQNKLELDRTRLDTDFGLVKEYLEKDKQAELANAERIGADKSLIESKYAEQEVRLREIVAENKRDIASNLLGDLVGIMGKESAAGKAVAIIQATIDTYSSAVSAFNSLSGIPIVGPVLGAAAAGLAVASGLKTVSKIASTPKPSLPKAERGMLIGGKRHSQGGTLIEAELGEAVMSRGAVKKYGRELSDMNVDGGGVPFFETGGVIGGGIAGSNNLPTSMGIDYDRMALAFKAGAESVTNVVSVEEINTVNSRVRVAENASSF